MDMRNVRIMNPYEDMDCDNQTIYIDESARDALHIDWEEEVMVVGRGKAKAKIKPLKKEDWGAQVVRMCEQMRDLVYCCVGDEVSLYVIE